MKVFSIRFAIALALAGFATNLHAQEADLTGGTLTIDMAPQLTTVLQAQGVSAGAYTVEASGSKVPFLPIVGGAFDLTSGGGTFSTSGAFYVINSTTRVKVVNLMFETVGAYPVVTGNIYVNGHYAGHNAILDVTAPNPLQAPFHAGNLIVHSIQATLSQFFSTLLSSTFNVTIPPSTPAVAMAINTELVTLSAQ